MDRNLKCQLCGKKLRVSPNCPCTLGEHLLAQHPDVDLTFYSSLEDLSYWKSYPQKKRDRGSKVLSCRKKSSLKVTKNASNGIYKTTVETWNPSQMKMECPRCQKQDKPCIRSNKNRASRNYLKALCMLSCWPVCFLPFAAKRNNVVELYCKYCRCVIAEYNRATGALLFK
ncbi:uncharacterized protein LOC130897946 [Diorhabda carinulata]|uniref:uncharacterized protein LOC130897946 n=1 Tax=Diorhabda carinulata TaxID=1163345 RepID=UPI0025A224FF|nr:uncharacterized protein LOC130897946 [Diorhabda carinulata]